MRKFITPLIMVMIIPCLAGCWNRVEVNDIAIVTAIGLDRVENGDIRLSLQIGIPANLGPIGAGGGNKGGKGTFIISETGETIADAYRKLQEKIARRIFFSHSRVLIIGEKLARNGVSQIIDFFPRYKEPRMNSFIMFTKGQASELLRSKSKLENVSSEETRELNKLNVGLKVSIKGFWEMMLAEGINPTAPAVNLKYLEVKNKSESKTEHSPSEKTQSIVGAAVFKKDKLVGWMNDAETRGILWLRNTLETGVITVNIPKKRGGGKISTKIISTKTGINPKLQGGQLTIEVNTRSEVIVVESTSKMNLTKTKMIEILQSKLEEDIRNKIQLALDKAQKQLHSDIFGFGRAVYQTYPKVWNRKYKKRWDEEFPKLNVTIKPKVEVKRIGLIIETK